MAQANASSHKTSARVSKTGWLAVVAGVATTTGAAIGAVNAALPLRNTLISMLNLPVCLSYADSYGGTQSGFRMEGAVWREYRNDTGALTFEFKEIRRTREVIMLRNLTPRPDNPNAASLVVHLPVCGGMAFVTEGLPERPTNLEEVWPARSGA